MKSPSFLFALALSLSLALSPSQAQNKKLNIAVPDQHPYVDPSQGREGHAYADETVNESRVYDFYSRQADYYLKSGDDPAVIPSFPGLDAALHGHWGKHNQNQHEDGRWNDVNMGTVHAQVMRAGKLAVEKATNVHLVTEGESSVGVNFDAKLGTYPVVWENGFIQFNGFRWGTSRNAAPGGKIWISDKGQAWNQPLSYQGYSRNGKLALFQYSVGDSQIIDLPRAVEVDGRPVFVRSLEFQNGATDLSVWIGHGDIITALKTEGELEAKLRREKDHHFLDIVSAKAGTTLHLSIAPGLEGKHAEQAVLPQHPQPSLLLKPGEAQWPDRLTVKGELGNSRDDSAYVVDTLHPPLENPYHTVMQLSGIDFLPDGDAIVSVLCGDVWKVSGLDEGLENVQWKRFATGLNQPIGVHIDEDGIFVLARDQLFRLHDENGDDEVDFYENYANDFGGYTSSHTHVFGLHRASDGTFYFVRREQLMATSPDPERKTREIAYGVRNCMGVGGAPDGPFLVAPQEGTWTPTSAILEVNEGNFFGLPGNRKNDTSFSPDTIVSPLCFIPRGIDNSTGGMVHIDSEKWGPYSGQFVGLSYGYGQHYLILRNTEGETPQGAVVPLEGNFAAGVLRGAFHPRDGQLYTVGLDGWGDYSTQDGCFHRVRYTGGPSHKPTDFRAFSNGLRIDFPEALDPASIDLKQVFAQQWNYEYSTRYGSPEFSIEQPSSLGHDRLEIKSATLSDDGKSLFLEIPKISPVMQLHARLHLKSAGGTPFATDLFTTVRELTHQWSADEGAVAVTPQKLLLRVGAVQKQDKVTETGEKQDHERKLVLHAAPGLRFQETLFEVKAGEDLVLHFVNSDVMPHNAVFVKEGFVKQVGEASFKMLNDPKAGQKHYVPDMDTVFDHTHVINPGNTHILHFQAPKEPGDHHFVCTFPGHWMTMQGILRVKP